MGSTLAAANRIVTSTSQMPSQTPPPMGAPKSVKASADHHNLHPAVHAASAGHHGHEQHEPAHVVASRSHPKRG
jgi:hypothetical protein